MSRCKVPGAPRLRRDQSFPSKFNRDTISDSDKGGGRKGAREDEGDSNGITRSLRSIVCLPLERCWSIVFAVGGGMTKGEEWGKEHSDGARGRQTNTGLCGLS